MKVARRSEKLEIPVEKQNAVGRARLKKFHRENYRHHQNDDILRTKKVNVSFQ